jgi:hypothetical protein
MAFGLFAMVRSLPAKEKRQPALDLPARLPCICATVLESGRFTLGNNLITNELQFQGKRLGSLAGES